MLFKIHMIRKVKMPSRGHATDAGLDFFIPEFSDKFLEDFEEKNPSIGIIGKNAETIILDPNYNACIPSGIKVEIPYGYMGLFLNKSGLASKNNLVIGAQVIDTFYSGEVHIDICIGLCRFPKLKGYADWVFGVLSKKVWGAFGRPLFAYG